MKKCFKKINLLFFILLYIQSSIFSSEEESFFYENKFKDNDNYYLKRDKDDYFLEKNINEFGINQVPNEIIIKIADYLFEDDFKNFLLTSKIIREIIFNYKPFFPNDKNIIQIIQNIKIENFDNVVKLVSRIPRKISIPQLDRINKIFQNYDCEENKDNIVKIDNLLKNFETFIKIKNVEWSIKNNYIDELKIIFNDQQKRYHQSILSYEQYYEQDQYNDFPTQFITFYIEKLSFLCKQYNEEYTGYSKEYLYLMTPLCRRRNPDKVKDHIKIKEFFKLIDLNTDY